MKILIKTILMGLLSVTCINSVALAAVVNSSAKTERKIGIAGPYQQGVVILNLEDYKNTPSVFVLAKCDPEGITMDVQSGLYNPHSDATNLNHMHGPYQEATVVLNLKDYQKDSSIKVLGKCSPKGIAMQVAAR